MQKGILQAASAYLLWGLFPIFFKWLAEVPAHEVLAHRVVWSLLLLTGVLLLKKQWLAWLRSLREGGDALRFALSGSLLALNWGVYIWAVQGPHVLDASLGYYMTPLVSVAMAATVLKEKLSRLQWLSIGIAAAGVTVMTVSTGRLPWVGLALALSFGTYGLLRKTARRPSLEGLALETLWLAPVAAGFLVWLMLNQTDAWHHAHATASAPLPLWALLMLTGPLTAVPLLLFGAGAQKIPLSVLGLLQYLSPTVQMLLGTWVYGETLTPARLFAFGAIWLALGLFSWEGWRQWRRSQAGQAASA